MKNFSTYPLSFVEDKNRLKKKKLRQLFTLFSEVYLVTNALAIRYSQQIRPQNFFKKDLQNKISYSRTGHDLKLFRF